MAVALKALIERFHIGGIVGELPSGGAQSGRALALMASANTLVSAVAACMGIPTAWCAPEDVKVAATGSKTASKPDIMAAMAGRYRIEVISKEVKCRVSKNCPEGVRTDHRYAVFGSIYAEGEFEHIADSIAAYEAMKASMLGRLSAKGKI
jgi:hypothetical protein